MGKIILHAAWTANAEKLQHYIPWKHDCFRYTIVNTLHKGDNKYYDNDNGGGGGGSSSSNNYHLYNVQDLTNSKYIQILSFKYHVLHAWRWPVWLKHGAQLHEFYKNCYMDYIFLPVRTKFHTQFYIHT
jgi:hypothetical protein